MGAGAGIPAVPGPLPDKRLSSTRDLGEKGSSPFRLVPIAAHRSTDYCKRSITQGMRQRLLRRDTPWLGGCGWRAPASGRRRAAPARSRPDATFGKEEVLMTHSFRLYPAAVVLAIALVAAAPVAAQTFSAGTDGLNTMSGGNTQVDLASFPGAATALGSSIVGGTVVNLQGVSLGSGFGPSVDHVVTR